MAVLTPRVAPGRTRLVQAPLAAVALVALGAAMWGTDGALRAPLVPRWSPWTIVLYEHLILSAVVVVPLLRRGASVRRIPARGWLAVVGVSWGGSALATLAFTAAFQYGNPDVVVLLQKTQPLWALVAAGALLGERPRADAGAAGGGGPGGHVPPVVRLDEPGTRVQRRRRERRPRSPWRRRRCGAWRRCWGARRCATPSRGR